jgi:hypothetical protein
MGIVVVILGIVFLALGAIPPMASAYATDLLRHRLAAPHATLALGAVPTWTLLGGHADAVDIRTGPTTINGWPVEDLFVHGGPVQMGKPAELFAGVVMRNKVLAPTIRQGVEAYAMTLAESLGVGGTSVADLAIELGPTTVVSGRFEAFGGLVAVPFHLAGQPDRLSPREVGLRHAIVTLSGHDQAIGDVPLVTVPETAGVDVNLTRLVMTPTELRVWATLTVSDPGRFLAPVQAGHAGNLPTAP